MGTGIQENQPSALKVGTKLFPPPLERREAELTSNGQWVGFPGGSDGKESACNVGDPDSIPGSGRSPGERNGNPLQYSSLENSMDRGAGQLQSMGSQRFGHN